MGSAPIDRVQRLAELAVGLGANVQAGQVLGITATLGQEELVRAIARSAYERGALYVTNNSRNWIETAATWGSPTLESQVLGLDDCWALALRRPPAASTR